MVSKYFVNIMRIIKDNNKNLSKFKFNKILNMQSLNMKFGKHLQKSMILKASKKETL